MKRIKSQRPGNGKREDSLTSELARPAMILEERDVIELLRAAVGRERSHFARRYVAIAVSKLERRFPPPWSCARRKKIRSGFAPITRQGADA
jgi:hypothetical protein